MDHLRLCQVAGTSKVQQLISLHLMDLGPTTQTQTLFLQRCNDILAERYLIGTSNIGQRKSAQHEVGDKQARNAIRLRHRRLHLQCKRLLCPSTSEVPYCP